MSRMTGPDCAVMCNLINTHTHTQKKKQPVVTGYKNTIRKERTYDVVSIQRESGNGTKNTRKKRHL